MKKTELEKLKNKSIDALVKLLNTKKLERDKLMVNRLAKTDKNIRKMRIFKLDIARISTIIREKEIINKLTQKDAI